jgi:bis(5'-nucleosyl)-tetraphosphatase (symmetrical)
MAVYAIGDVQGCYDSLVKLLDTLKFDLAKDQIWLAGDIVNRGPKSLEVMRFARSLGDTCKIVLGNHDLHLIAKASGRLDYHHRLDTLMPILQADDCDELIDWLRKQSLFYYDAALNFSMVHAGVPPEWDIQTCLARAAEVESVIGGEDWRAYFLEMYGDTPHTWQDDLSGWDRLRYITNCFTRLRYFHNDGRIALKFKGGLKQSLKGQTAWFKMPNRKTVNDRILFGHWSTLGIGQYGEVFSLDSGAVWGEKLTAIQIDQPNYVWTQVDVCD